MMKNNKFTVLIPDGESNLALQVLRCLAQVPSLRVDILSSDPLSLVRFSKYRSKYLMHKAPDDSKEKFEIICNAIKKTNADVVLPVDVPVTRLIASYKDLLEPLAALPPIASPEQIDIAGDKGLLAGFLLQNNIPTPDSVVYRNNEKVNWDILKLAFPVLAKPRVARGGEGIKIFNRLSELKDYFNSECHPENYVIQTCIDGYDIGCSVLCKNGEILAYTMEKRILPPDVPFAPRTGIDFFYDDQVYKIVQRLMQALNWSGVANIDLRYDEADGLPKVLEINTRYWGNLIGSLISGVNFPYLSCLCGLRFDLPVSNYQLKRYVSIKAKIGLLKKRYMEKSKSIDPWLGETGIKYVLKDPFPEIYKDSVRIYKRMFDK